MTYSGTDKNVYIVNCDGTNEWLSIYVAFDEAHMSSTDKNLPLMATVLQHAGYTSNISDNTNITSSLKIQLLQHHNATIPNKETDKSAGYNISCCTEYTIPPPTQMLIDTRIALEMPQGCFGQLKSRSGLALKHNIHVKAGTIDADYHGEIKVILSNESSTSFYLPTQTRIAQLIIFQIPDMYWKKLNNYLQQNKIKADSVVPACNHDLLTTSISCNKQIRLQLQPQK